MVLAVREVHKRFGGVLALDGVTFEVPPGTLYGIVGPNGAGKSVLFNVITGQLAPDGGRIWFEEEEITSLPAPEVARRGIARTFQEPRVFPSLAVLDHVLLARQARDLAPSLARLVSARAAHDDRETAGGFLAEVELANVAHLPAGVLSYGQRKLLAFAMAAAAGPRFILLDEPAAGVNPRVVEVLMAAMQSRQAAGVTFMIVEHNMRVIMGLCHRVLVLSQGRVVTEGTPAEVQADPRVLDVYFGG